METVAYVPLIFLSHAKLDTISPLLFQASCDKLFLGFQ